MLGITKTWCKPWQLKRQMSVRHRFTCMIHCFDFPSDMIQILSAYGVSIRHQINSPYHFLITNKYRLPLSIFYFCNSAYRASGKLWSTFLASLHALLTFSKFSCHFLAWTMSNSTYLKSSANVGGSSNIEYTARHSEYTLSIFPVIPSFVTYKKPFFALSSKKIQEN